MCKSAAMLMLLVCASLSLLAQNMIKGTVINSQGIGIQGVTVTVKGTRISAQTDASGAYTISAPTATPVLIFTSIGFTTQVLPSASATTVILLESSKQLEDIVVVAYGTKNKSDLTGSVTAVTEKDFQKGNINSSEQLLQGKVAGLEVTTGGGSAGGGSKIRIRGTASLNASNDPLIVIDGVPVEGNGIAGSANVLSTINPDDIESMSVLKDASAAALYGSRASNGVIIITTKKGRGDKFTFNFNTKASMSEITKQVDVLSGDQIREIVNANGTAEYKGFLGSANTDWQDQIYRKAYGYDNNLSASGVANVANNFSLPIRASVGVLNQEGILKTNKFERVSGSINLSPKLMNDRLSFNINAKYSNAKTRFANEGAIGSAVRFDPTQPVYSGNSRFGGFYEWLQPASTTVNNLAPRNPLGLLEQRNNTSDVNRFIGNVQMDYKLPFLTGLHLLANLGIDATTGRGYDIQDSVSAGSVIGNQGKGSYNTYKQRKESQLADVQLFYETNLPSIKSKLDILVGHSFQDFYTFDNSYRSSFQDYTFNPTSVVLFPTDKNGFAIDSYLGRINYSYDSKYYITGTMRRDASSKFSPENRVGYFPSVSAAWRIKEDFFKRSTAVSELKLRGSYGITGQQDGIGYYNYLPRYSFGSNSAQYQIGDQFIQFLRPSAYDPSVKWEESTTTNIGLDFGFLNNRISGTVDVYQKDTKDLLSVVPVASGANFNIELLKNVGSLQNRGIEVTLNTIPVQTNKVTWNFGVNAAYNEIEITKLNEIVIPDFKGISVSGISGGTGNNIGVFAVGYAPYTFFAKQQVYDANGKPIDGVFNDINRDGVVSPNDLNDRRYYKKPAPDVIFGVNTSLTIAKFTLGLTGHGQLGNYLYNNQFSNSATLRNILDPVKYIGNASTNYLETGFTNNRYLSDYYIENASFFRMDNINLGYDFGKFGRGGSTALRLTANVQNVFVVTKYSGTDPENASGSGVDNNIYPRPRIYSLGASLNF